MEQVKQKRFALNADTLNIIAVITMIIDHSGMMLFGNNQIMRIIGRIAFTIFCFQIVEGAHKTHDWIQYLFRLILWGLISEVPFDLMTRATLFYPSRNNVMFELAFCLVISVGIMRVKQGVRERKVKSLIGSSLQKDVQEESRGAAESGIILILVAVLIFSICSICGVGFDYGIQGILLAVLFSLTYDIPNRRLGCAIQAIGYLVIFGIGSIQVFGCLGLAFIWAYNGQRKKTLDTHANDAAVKAVAEYTKRSTNWNTTGCNSRMTDFIVGFKRSAVKYSIYPIHMMVLCVIYYFCIL